MKDSMDATAVGRAVDPEVFANRKLIRPALNRNEHPRQEAERRERPADRGASNGKKTPPPEQTAFRLDFPAWRATLADRDRRLMHDLMVGERTADVARQYGMTPGRVSQKRRQFMQDWQRFGEPPAATALV